MRLANRAWIALSISCLVAACTSAPPPKPAPRPLAQQFSAQLYAIAPSEVLRVDVYREPDLSGEYYVDPSGTINLPLIGRVAVAGENVTQVESKLELLLSRGFIKDPDVQVAIARFRPIYITGEVKSAGEYPFAPGITVRQGITLAGGPTRFAAEKYFLERNTQQGEQVIRVDAGTILHPGDVLTVGERLF